MKYFCCFWVAQDYLEIAFKMQPLEKSISQIKVILSKLICHDSIY